MKAITLVTGEQALVDDSDYEKLSTFEWKLLNGYAYRTVKGKGIQFMHHDVLPVKSGKVTDHENRNKLDNQRHNLRSATHSQNHANTLSPKVLKTSKFKGVSFHAAAKKWEASLMVNKKKRYLGLHLDETEAARAYNAAAVEAFGPFAGVNQL